MQHGGFAAVSGSKNKINIAVQAMLDDIFNKLRFVHKKGAKLLVQHREGRGTHRTQNTMAVVHCWLIVGGQRDCNDIGV